jgi:hypothetical protein
VERCAKAHFEPKGAQSSRKDVIAVTKLSTFDMSLNAVSSGLDGYEKPNAAQTAKTRKNPAREKSVYLDNLVRGENLMRKIGKSLEEIRMMKPSVILSGHIPIARNKTGLLLRLAGTLPGLPAFVAPNQEAFSHIASAMLSSRT